MKRAVPMNWGGEYDFLTGWRKYICKRSLRNMSAYVKRRFRRRERRHLNKEMKKEAAMV